MLGGAASTLVLMDCPGGQPGITVGDALELASTLVLMDCPGGHAKLGPHVVLQASTLVLMDCPGGHQRDQHARHLWRLQPLF